MMRSGGRARDSIQISQQSLLCARVKTFPNTLPSYPSALHPGRGIALRDAVVVPNKRCTESQMAGHPGTLTIRRGGEELAHVPAPLVFREREQRAAPDFFPDSHTTTASRARTNEATRW